MSKKNHVIVWQPVLLEQIYFHVNSNQQRKNKWYINHTLPGEGFPPGLRTTTFAELACHPERQSTFTQSKMINFMHMYISMLQHGLNDAKCYVKQVLTI